MRALLLAVLLVAPVALASPTQVHLGITDDPSRALSVHWLDTDLRDDAVVILRGPEGEREVPAVRVEGPSAGFAYEAALDGLSPGSSYEYELPDGSSFAFVAPREDGAFSFLALGDMGVSSQAEATMGAVLDLDPAFVLHAGDLSYAEGDPVEWAEWFGLVEPFAAQRPWIPALGNHETYTGSSAQGIAGVPSPIEMAFFAQRFGLPGNELRYSFDWQGAHFVALDTYSERSIPADEAAWLEADLAAHGDATWTIVVLHEPPYSSNANHGSSERVQEAFVAAFERHGVDLVIAAHDHAYERSFPMRDGRATTTDAREYVEGEGVVYVVTGGAGALLYRDWEPRPEWSAARRAMHHVLAVDVSPDALAARLVATDGGSFADAFRIVKDSAPPGSVPAAVGGSAAPGAGLLVALAALAIASAARRR